MLFKRTTVFVCASVICAFVLAGTGNTLIGWQTFEVSGGNNTPVNDATPDTNSTYDPTPFGSISASNHYLTGEIGDNVSVDPMSPPHGGFGVNISSNFLNGPNFGGNDLMNEAGEGIENWPLADLSLIHI